MKRSRFSEEQIIAVLKEHELGGAGRRASLQMRCGVIVPRLVRGDIDTSRSVAAYHQHEHSNQCPFAAK